MLIPEKRVFYPPKTLNFTGFFPVALELKS